ncbi:MAG: hypothetical protein V3U57_07505 [Robiginitomaculum sp.]
MIITGVKKVLLGEPGWEYHFDLTKTGFLHSFLAVILYIPLSFIIARAAVKYNDVLEHIPYSKITLVLLFIALSFPLIAYILVSIFDKQATLCSWIIVRHWTILFALAVIAAGFSLYLIGLLPFSVAFFIGMSCYIGTLAIDVFLTRHVANFDWIGAVFSGVLISATNIMILLFSLNYL